MFATVGLLIGFALGLRFKVIILPLAIIAAALVVGTSAISSGHSAWAVGWAVAQVALLIQVGYLAGALGHHLAVTYAPKERPFALVKKIE
jgi:hypothetical protein